MKVANIKDDHHFVKHCKNSQLIREQGAITAVYPWALELRPPSKDYTQEKTLSGVYYEFFDGDKSEKVCACYHFIKIEIKAKDALVRMGVGSIKEQGSKRSRSLRVTHEPDKDCLAYAAIHGLPTEPDDELSSLLASLAILEILEVSTIL
jgi:hypothetical protein